MADSWLGQKPMCTVMENNKGGAPHPHIGLHAITAMKESFELVKGFRQEKSHINIINKEERHKQRFKARFCMCAKSIM